jgi:DsbC/DsbD-like thiol-disulfide interchange protein
MDAADLSRAEYQIWHVHNAGGPVLSLKVRFRDDIEVADWRNGPGLAEALQQAMDEGWQVYDHEPGDAPGEYAIVYLGRLR